MGYDAANVIASSVNVFKKASAATSDVIRINDTDDIPVGIASSVGRNVGSLNDVMSEYMSVAHGGAPYVTIYKRSGDTFTN